MCRPARTCHLPEPHCWLAAVAVAGLELVSATVVGEVRGVPLRRALAREEARAPCASRVLANAAADVLASTGQHCAPRVNRTYGSGCGLVRVNRISTASTAKGREWVPYRNKFLPLYDKIKTSNRTNHRTRTIRAPEAAPVASAARETASEAVPSRDGPCASCSETFGAGSKEAHP